MKSSICVLVPLILAFIGCSKYPAADELPSELLNEATLLIENNNFGFFDLDSIPDAIKQLHPESVHLNEEGVYIRLWISFAEEGGLFIPRDKAKKYDRNTDPGYWQANEGVYYYIIKG